MLFVLCVGFYHHTSRGFSHGHCVSHSRTNQRPDIDCDTPSAQPPLGQVMLSPHIMQQVELWKLKLSGSYLAEESKSDAWPPLKIVHFVQLALVQQEKHARHLDLRTPRRDIDEVYGQKNNVTYNELFQNLDRSPLTLIEGRPGSGKTTLLVRISCDWAKKKILTSKLVIFVRLRYLDKSKEVYLHDLLRVACPLSQEDIKRLSSYIESRLGEGVVFLLDGFDEYSVGASENNFICNLVQGRVFSRSAVILSSRPAATQEFHQIATQWIEVVGFMKEQVMKYVDTYFELDKDKSVHLKTHLEKHPNLMNICYLPLYCAMLVYLYGEDSLLPETETEFYRDFVLSFFVRNFRKKAKNLDLTSINQLPPKEKKCLNDICHLAFDATIVGQQVFEKSQLSKVFDKESLSNNDNPGLLVVDRYFVKFGVNETYSFLHLTLQDYLSATYIAGCGGSEQVSIAKTHCNSKKQHLFVMWRFLFGVLDYSKESTMNLFKLVLDATHNEHLFHIQCAYESHQSNFCTKVLQFHKHRLKFSRMNSIDLPHLTYVLKTAEYTNIELNFVHCDFQTDDAVALFNGVSHHQLLLKV